MHFGDFLFAVWADRIIFGLFGRELFAHFVPPFGVERYSSSTRLLVLTPGPFAHEHTALEAVRQKHLYSTFARRPIKFAQPVSFTTNIRRMGPNVRLQWIDSIKL